MLVHQLQLQQPNLITYNIEHVGKGIKLVDQLSSILNMELPKFLTYVNCEDMTLTKYKWSNKMLLLALAHCYQNLQLISILE